MQEPEDDPTTISELESDLQGALDALLVLAAEKKLPAELRPLLWLAPPEGASVHVSLRERDSGRQIRRHSPVGAWDPRQSAAWIVYEVPQGDAGARVSSSGDPRMDFILALDHAERDPHLSFISLKWFRDTYLLKRGVPWAGDPDIPRRVIQEATEEQVLLTHKVPNPKQPNFPVTSIRLNRQHPDVVRVLKAAGMSDEEIAQPQPEARDTTQ